jgi:GH18 family chitinase
MAKQLDYIVYMTYDLHGMLDSFFGRVKELTYAGQWDAGNQWATEGCPEGNCLRSHGMLLIEHSKIDATDL